jgi:NADH:quinone reductase (non-electrogenic)
VEGGMWWASMSQVHVKDVPTVKQVIDRMISDAADIVRGRLAASLADRSPA